jgi:hypothetical protein
MMRMYITIVDLIAHIHNSHWSEVCNSCEDSIVFNSLVFARTRRDLGENLILGSTLVGVAAPRGNRHIKGALKL